MEDIFKYVKLLIFSFRVCMSRLALIIWEVSLPFLSECC